jgi:hypothetical protein
MDGHAGPRCGCPGYQSPKYSVRHLRRHRRIRVAVLRGTPAHWADWIKAGLSVPPMFQRSPAIVPSLTLGMAKLGFFISAIRSAQSRLRIAGIADRRC